MFHYFIGKIQKYGDIAYIQNSQLGIEVNYLGQKSEGEFFLYPHIDDSKKTIRYFAFDSFSQKNSFEDLLKISGIGPKTAFQIVQLPSEELYSSVQNLDIKYFQNIPGIGPKTAKKILLEMKGNFDLQDIQKIDIDQKLYRDIVKSLKGFGYDADRIKEFLQKYPSKITKSNMAEVIKRVIGQI